MTVGFSTYVNNFVYPRSEGMKLERSLEQMETRSQRVDTEISSKLQRMEDEYRADIRAIRERMEQIMSAVNREVYSAPPPPMRLRR